MRLRVVLILIFFTWRDHSYVSILLTIDSKQLVSEAIFLESMRVRHFFFTFSLPQNHDVAFCIVRCQKNNEGRDSKSKETFIRTRSRISISGDKDLNKKHRQSTVFSTIELVTFQRNQEGNHFCWPYYVHYY